MEVYVKKDYGYSFAKYIMRRFIKSLVLQYKPKKAEVINGALIRAYNFDDVVYVWDVLKEMCKHLEIIVLRDQYTIRINPNARFKKEKLIDLVKFITYGGLNIKGYPIVRDIMKDINDNIESLYQELSGDV